MCVKQTKKNRKPSRPDITSSSTINGQMLSFRHPPNEEDPGPDFIPFSLLWVVAFLPLRTLPPRLMTAYYCKAHNEQRNPWVLDQIRCRYHGRPPVRHFVVIQSAITFNALRCLVLVRRDRIGLDGRDRGK